MSLSAALISAQAPVRWLGAVELSLGGADADERTSFGRVAGIAVNATGRMYVADAQDSQIRAFSPEGGLLARIGRAGAGPLEFKRLSGIGFSPDGLLWIRDEGNARMLAANVTSVPASNVKTVPLVQFTGGNRRPLRFFADGSTADETIWFDKAMETFRPIRLRRSSAGAIMRTDTVKVPAGAFAAVHKIVRTNKDANGKPNGMAERYYFQPFGGEWLRAYGPGGVRADVVTSRYDVRIVDGEERMIRTLTRRVPPVPLSARERRSADSTMNATRAQLPFGVPATKAPIVGLMYGEEGQLWIERAMPDGAPREADVFDRNGKLLAIAEWPRTMDLYNGFPVIVGTTVVASVLDDDDVPRLVRVRFTASPPRR